MEFIDTFLASSDFVVYTLAERMNVIHPIIIIELYYNYCFRLKHSKHPSQFKFKNIIARLMDKTDNYLYSKSLLVVEQIQRDLGKYKNIVIVDDMGDDVWFNKIPNLLMQQRIMIYAVQIFAYECTTVQYQESMYRADDELFTLTRSVEEHGIVHGSRNTFFHRLCKSWHCFISLPSTFQWMSTFFHLKSA